MVECILFAVGQPRDCFIRSVAFEAMPSALGRSERSGRGVGSTD